MTASVIPPHSDDIHIMFHTGGDNRSSKGLISDPKCLAAILSRNASAVSDAPCPTPENSLPLLGRVRYSCLKEAAGGEVFMEIECCWGDEKGFGKREWN